MQVNTSNSASGASGWPFDAKREAFWESWPIMVRLQWIQAVNV